MGARTGSEAAPGRRREGGRRVAAAAAAIRGREVAHIMVRGEGTTVAVGVTPERFDFVLDGAVHESRYQDGVGHQAGRDSRWHDWHVNTGQFLGRVPGSVITRYRSDRTASTSVGTRRPVEPACVVRDRCGGGRDPHPPRRGARSRARSTRYGPARSGGGKVVRRSVDAEVVLQIGRLLEAASVAACPNATGRDGG